MKNVKIECPSCGSALNAEEGTSRVLCEFCGSSVIVEDSKMEGYNQELGKMEARADVSNNLADTVLELINPYCDMDNKKSDLSALEKQLKAFTMQDKMLSKGAKVYSYVIASVLAFIILMILIASQANFFVFLIFDIVCVALFPIVGKLVFQYWKNISTSIEGTQKAIIKDKETIDAYAETIVKYKDINIPQKYRNPTAMKYISEAVRSQGANTLEHAFSQYDDLLMKQKMIALQEEQIKLQKAQLEQSKKPQVKVVKQRGHSIVIHLILCGFGIGFITIPYYTLSKHHYWHL